jgi:hypothetical protein
MPSILAEGRHLPVSVPVDTFLPRMKNLLLTTVSVAAVVGGASAAVVGIWLAPEATRSAPQRAGESAATTSVRDEELRHELDRLLLENQSLTARIEALERRPQPAERIELAASAPTTSEEAAAAGDDVRSMLLATDLPETVRATLEEIRAEEEAQEELRREEREAARREERLARLQEEYGLSNGQVNDLRTLMIEARTAREDLIRQRAEGVDRESLRTARAELRTRDAATLQRILTPAQYQAWQERENRDEESDENRGEERGRRGGGRGQG